MSFSGIAVQFTMIEDLQFGPVEMGYSMVLISFPWCLKPLYGLISDSFPIFDWGNRRPYISFFLFLAAFFYVFINEVIKSKRLFVIALMTISWTVCYADVCADSIMVTIAKKEKKKGNIQSICWGARAFGTLIGAVFGGISYTAIGGINVFRICAIMPFVTSVLIWKLPIIQLKSRNIDVLYQLYSNLKDQKQLAFLLFVINISPDYGQFYVYFLEERLHYTPSQFSWLSVSGSLTFLLSTITFNRFLTDKNPGSIIFMGLIGTYMCRLAQLFVVLDIFPYFWIVLFDGVAESFFGTLILMPLLVIVAEGCRDGVEGSLYSMMMAISNLSGITGKWLGTITGYFFGVSREHFENLHWFILLCATLELITPMFFIRKKSSSYADLPETELDHTLEPDDPDILMSNKETSEIQEENNRARSANRQGFWGKNYWQARREMDRMRDDSANKPAIAENMQAT